MTGRLPWALRTHTLTHIQARTHTRTHSVEWTLFSCQNLYPHPPHTVILLHKHALANQSRYPSPHGVCAVNEIYPHAHRHLHTCSHTRTDAHSVSLTHWLVSFYERYSFWYKRTISFCQYTKRYNHKRWYILPHTFDFVYRCVFMITVLTCWLVTHHSHLTDIIRSNVPPKPGWLSLHGFTSELWFNNHSVIR